MKTLAGFMLLLRLRPFAPFLHHHHSSACKLNVARQRPFSLMKDTVVTTSPSAPKKAKTEDAATMPAEQISLRFAKLSENATTPTRGSDFAAGFDLFSAYSYKILPGGKEIVKTDIQIAVPEGCYGRVAPRSGLTVKHFIDVGAGVIDQDYRGNVGVVLFNFSDKEFEVKKGDRVAQLICERIFLPELEELPALDKTDRGSGGYGSTGK